MPAGLEIAGNEAFDPVKMRELYDVGYAAGQKAAPWFNEPPGFRNMEAAP
jgi:hypothetical protein